MHRLRIISGKYGKQLIQSVGIETTRETTDKVRESIFNLLGQYFDGGIVLDLFAGSGALGIESLSRGTDKVFFIDINPKACTTIRQNLEHLKISSDQFEIYKNDAFKMLDYFHKNKQSFDYIFIDPPYHEFNAEEIIQRIYQYQLLNLNGSIIVEQLKDKDLLIPKEYIMVKKRNISIRDIVIIERIK